MYLFPFLAAFLLIKHLRKSLQNNPVYPKWDKWLNSFSWITVGVFFSIESISGERIADLIAAVYLVGILAYIYNEPDFKGSQSFINAVFPLALVSGRN